MKFIQTNYLPIETKVDVSNTRVYGTTCDDKHFIEIIDTHRGELVGELVFTNILYVLMDNEYIEAATKFYASISIHKEKKGDQVSYYPCVVTYEKQLSLNIHLKYFLEKVIECLSYENAYFSFDKEHKENIKMTGNEQKIITELMSECVKNIKQ